MRSGAPNTARRERGRRAWHSGMTAEKRIAADYQRRGFTVAAQRWRSEAGEIDLICRLGPQVVFVEVKKACNLEQAAERLAPSQVVRIRNAAAAFLGGEPQGELTPARFDVALVDSRGDFRVIENAFGHD